MYGYVDIYTRINVPSGRKFPRAQIFVIFMNYKVIMNFFHGNLGMPLVLLNTETQAECQRY